MGEQFDKSISPNQLRKAALQCRKGVFWKASVYNFCSRPFTSTLKLRNEVLEGRYKISPYVKFKIHEPKERDILASRIRDRVLQRAFCDNGVYDDMVRPNIRDNGACQRGRGTDDSIRRLICYMERYYRAYGDNHGYAKHLDARKYFPSTPHSESNACFERNVNDKSFLPYLRDVIESYVDERPNDVIDEDPFGARGTGLGSPMSQLVELALLSPIDHGIKEGGFRVIYLRYMDDIILVGRERNDVDAASEYIISMSADHGITIVDKGGTFPLEHGIRFLRKLFVLTETGKVVVRLDHKSISRERRQLRKLKELLDAGEITMLEVERHYQSFVGRIERFNCRDLLIDMDRYYANLFRKRPDYKFKGRKNKHVSLRTKAAAPRAAGKRGSASRE